MATVNLDTNIYLTPNRGINPTVLNRPASYYQSEYNAIVDFFVAEQPSLLPILQELVNADACIHALTNKVIQQWSDNERSVHILAYLKATVAYDLKWAYERLKSNPDGSGFGNERYRKLGYGIRLMLEKLPSNKAAVFALFDGQGNDAENARKWYYTIYGEMIRLTASDTVWNGDGTRFRYENYEFIQPVYAALPAASKWRLNMVQSGGGKVIGRTGGKDGYTAPSATAQNQSPGSWFDSEKKGKFFGVVLSDKQKKGLALGTVVIILGVVMFYWYKSINA